MYIKLSFEMDNDAFQDDAHAEAGRILAEVGSLVSKGVTAGSVRDRNGNRVGSFVITSRRASAQKAALTRAANQSPERRSEIARKAANARWGKRGAAS